MNDYLSLISKYTEGEHPQTVPAFIIHSALVTKKALDIADKYVKRTGEEIDMRLLEEMGMLHDIGIFRTREEKLFTQGEGDYILHLDYGHEILSEEGLHTHAGAAKNHANISKEDITSQQLPLGNKQYVPQTPEEEILHVADQFFSKRFNDLFTERSVAEVLSHLRKYDGKAERFQELYAKYCEH